MSKYDFRASDIYLPGTDIPYNRLDIRDPELLHEVEQELLQRAYPVLVGELQADTCFDEAYFKALHQRAFEALYEWAGIYRTLDMSKGDSLFCRAVYLNAESRRLFARLAEEDYLRQASDWPTERFAERLAYYQCELIALHPFYEVNGRITRLFCDLIALYNGYDPIDYRNAVGATPEENRYLAASIACVQHADPLPLQAIILAGLSKRGAA